MKVRRYRHSAFYRKKTHPGRWVLLALILALAVVAVYTLVDNGRIQVRSQRVLVPDLPEALEGFSVVLISDMNGRRFGPGNEQLATVINKTNCNAVLCVGDMVGEKGKPQPFYELIAALQAPVFFVEGDNDPLAVGGQAEGYYSALAEWVNGAQSRGAVYLSAPASLSVKGQTVWFSDASLLGLDFETTLSAYSKAEGAAAAYRAEQLGKALAARENILSSGLHIVLSHGPLGNDSILRMLASTDENVVQWLKGTDLLACGGTCGGQWRLPWLGGLYYREWFPDQSLLRGYSYAGPLPQYVTAGLSSSDATPLPPFRLFNTPEVVLLTFTGQYEPDTLPL